MFGNFSKFYTSFKKIDFMIHLIYFSHNSIYIHNNIKFVGYERYKRKILKIWSLFAMANGYKNRLWYVNGCNRVTYLPQAQSPFELLKKSFADIINVIIIGIQIRQNILKNDESFGHWNLEVCSVQLR